MQSEQAHQPHEQIPIPVFKGNDTDQAFADYCRRVVEAVQLRTQGGATG